MPSDCQTTRHDLIEAASIELRAVISGYERASERHLPMFDSILAAIAVYRATQTKEPRDEKAE